MRRFFGRLFDSEFAQPFIILAAPLVFMVLFLSIVIILFVNSFRDCFGKEARDG